MDNEHLSELVISAQNGNSEALNQLFNEYYNDLYYFALKTVKDSDLASDITQEAFIDIFNNIGTLKEPVAFISWAKKITYFQCTRYFKKKKDIIVDEDEGGNTVFDTLQEDNTEFIPDEALEKDDFKKTVMAMIDELSEEQRSAVMMYYFDEMSVSEIAEIQGVSEGTVKSRLNYARKAIKKSVEEYEKKHNVKLHAIPFFPFFKWLFDNVFEKEMPVSVAEKVAEGVSASTGAPVAVFGTATATTTVATTTATVGVVSKFMALPLVTKIVAGVVATSIVIGGVAGGVSLLKDDAINTNANGDSNSIITGSTSSTTDIEGTTTTETDTTSTSETTSTTSETASTTSSTTSSDETSSSTTITSTTSGTSTPTTSTPPVVSLYYDGRYGYSFVSGSGPYYNQFIYIDVKNYHTQLVTGKDMEVLLIPQDVGTNEAYIEGKNNTMLAISMGELYPDINVDVTWDELFTNSQYFEVMGGKVIDGVMYIPRKLAGAGGYQGNENLYDLSIDGNNATATLIPNYTDDNNVNNNDILFTIANVKIYGGAIVADVTFEGKTFNAHFNQIKY